MFEVYMMILHLGILSSLESAKSFAKNSPMGFPHSHSLSRWYINIPDSKVHGASMEWLQVESERQPAWRNEIYLAIGHWSKAPRTDTMPRVFLQKQEVAAIYI